MELDFIGKHIKITDYTGLIMNIQYDKKGGISELVTERNGNNYGNVILRNDKVQLEIVHSSRGDEYYTYNSTNALSKLIVKNPGYQVVDQAIVKFTLQYYL